MDDIHFSHTKKYTENDHPEFRCGPHEETIREKDPDQCMCYTKTMSMVLIKNNNNPENK